MSLAQAMYKFITVVIPSIIAICTVTMLFVLMGTSDRIDRLKKLFKRKK